MKKEEIKPLFKIVKAVVNSYTEWLSNEKPEIYAVWYPAISELMSLLLVGDPNPERRRSVIRTLHCIDSITSNSGDHTETESLNDQKTFAFIYGVIDFLDDELEYLEEETDEPS